MKRGTVLELEITDFAFGGKGIAKIASNESEFIVFVENTFPGQKVIARVNKKKKNYAECKLIKIINHSHLEKKNNKYQAISGAPYLQLPIEIQEKYKLNSSLELFKRIGGIENIDLIFDEFISSPKLYNYRNKMEYSFSSIEHELETDKEIDNAFAVGFKHRGTWWKVEQLKKESGLFDAQWENQLFEFSKFLQQFELPAWHPPQKKGFFRHIVVRKSFFQDKLLINLVTSSQGIEKFNVKTVSEYLQNVLGNRLAGFQHTINDDVADRAKIENGQSQLIFGISKIIEEICNLKFEISMQSFFQTNPLCAELLYTKAMQYAFESNDSKKWMMDLFCGTGTIAQLMSKYKSNTKIIGVDIVEEAIEDAKKNAKRNNILDIDFYASDVGKFLKEYPEYNSKIGTILLDPPRAGIAPKTLQKIIDMNAEIIVYISCNPSTQSRDTKTLIEVGYVLEKLSFVDQFPHTSHIESIAKFVRK